MSVRKSPEVPKRNPIDIDALINKGAKVTQDQIETKKWIKFTLRITSEMVKEVDQNVTKRVGISRTGWILEAIHEKLERSKK